MRSSWLMLATKSRRTRSMRRSAVMSCSDRTRPPSSSGTASTANWRAPRRPEVGLAAGRLAARRGAWRATRVERGGPEGRDEAHARSATSSPTLGERRRLRARRARSAAGRRPGCRRSPPRRREERFEGRRGRSDRSRRPRGERVADAAHRAEVVVPVAAAQLAAQPADVDVDGAPVAERSRSPRFGPAAGRG